MNHVTGSTNEIICKHIPLRLFPFSLFIRNLLRPVLCVEFSEVEYEQHKKRALSARQPSWLVCFGSTRKKDVGIFVLE